LAYSGWVCRIDDIADGLRVAAVHRARDRILRAVLLLSPNEIRVLGLALDVSDCIGVGKL
jgi:hypothetical protein